MGSKPTKKVIEKTLKCVAISDTHNQHDQLKLPDGDVLIHAGDFSRKGNYEEFENFIKWFDSQPHKHKIFIAGNHDVCLQAMIGNEKQFMSALKKTGRIKGENLHYLRDSSVEIEGKVFYGAPWQPFFCDWAFQCQRGKEMAEKWALIPDKVDVLITHGPPYGHGDLAPPYFSPMHRNAGCFELLKRVIEIQPRAHIFGHIHCGRGTTQSDETTTTFFNVSTCNEQYKPDNPPQIITIE